MKLYCSGIQAAPLPILNHNHKTHNITVTQLCSYVCTFTLGMFANTLCLLTKKFGKEYCSLYFLQHAAFLNIATDCRC